METFGPPFSRIAVKAQTRSRDAFDDAQRCFDRAEAEWMLAYPLSVAAVQCALFGVVMSGVGALASVFQAAHVAAGTNTSAT